MEDKKPELFPTVPEMLGTMLFCIAKTGEFVKNAIKKKMEE